MTTDYYVLVVYDNITPDLVGPYRSEKERDQEAKELRYQEGTEHGYFKLMLDIDFDVKVDTYPNKFFEEVDT